MSLHAFSELALATYCPRKLYYQQQHGWDPPDVSDRRALAFRYPELVDADDATLSALPIDLPPATYRERLATARDRVDEWSSLADPDRRDVLLTGREARGIAHKVIDGDPPIPSLVFTGTPPDEGVWTSQTVRVVAAAKALAWECQREVPRAYVEYPTHGVIRPVRLTTRRKAAYRKAVRAVESLDGPPPRLRNRAKCDPCEYADECGVRTRSLRSLLGL